MSNDRTARKIVVLTAPSGSGKTTIARAVLASVAGMRFSVSATTRPARAYEKDGVHYHFLDEPRFRALIDEDAFLEYEEVYPGRFYGTPRSEVDQATAEAPVLLDIDVKGALNVKEQYGDDALVLFVRPPSLDELRRRLEGRATETEETLQQRLDTARRELDYADRFDAVVVNDDLDEAIAETLRRIRQFLNG